MKKEELIRKTDEVINETANALQTIYDALNSGQQKKILKDETVAKILARYNVTT